MNNTNVKKKDQETKEPLLSVENLKMHFPVRNSKSIFAKKKYFPAVDGVNFSINKRETFGLVGESGCGKSTMARTIIRLNNPTEGNVYLEEKDLSHATGKELLSMRRNIQMIFQDPYASLNPRMTVEALISEPLHIFKAYNMLDITEAEISKRVDFLLERVGLGASMKKRFPHEFSGGQRQRIGIARALIIYPKLIIADEPISALDVSVQAQILNLLKELQDEFDLTYLFIAHDLTVVNFISNRIAVMYLGKIVEIYEVDEHIHTSNEKVLHPYTKMLLNSILIPDPSQEQDRLHKGVKGEVDLSQIGAGGCPFYHRCPMRKNECKEIIPELREIAPNHYVACIQI